MTRGYLWTALEAEIAAEFATPTPLEVLLTHMLAYQRPDGPQQTPTEAVRACRDRRRAAGVCIDCERVRDPESKSYCYVHRELDRVKAAQKRERKKTMADENSSIEKRPLARGERERLPETREGICHHFSIKTLTEDGVIEDIKGYIHANTYEDGRLAEVFVRSGKSGSSASMLDEFAKPFSCALQYGAPLEVLCEKHIRTRFGVAGRTKNKDIPMCSSLTDYVCRFLLSKFGKNEVPGVEVEMDTTASKGHNGGPA